VFVAAGALVLSFAAIPISLLLNAINPFHRGPGVPGFVWFSLVVSAISFFSFLFAHWKYDHTQHDRGR
jgi:uncharacterized YccA/Bax inhibitor family protein